MADETSQMEVERENSIITIADQPAKTADPQYYEGTIFGLPKEWIAEIRPRKADSKYFGKVDQFFYEPGTHRQFRSLKAAKRHLGLDMGETNQKRKSKTSKAECQSEDKFAWKTAGQSENADKDKFGPSRKVAEDNKRAEHYHYFNNLAKRIRRQLINGEENSWNLYIKIPDVVQQRWMYMFLQPKSNNQESNPRAMS